MAKMDWEKVVESLIEQGDLNASQAQKFLDAGNAAAAVQRTTIANICTVLARAVKAGAGI